MIVYFVFRRCQRHIHSMCEQAWYLLYSAMYFISWLLLVCKKSCSPSKSLPKKLGITRKTPENWPFQQKWKVIVIIVVVVVVVVVVFPCELIYVDVDRCCWMVRRWRLLIGRGVITWSCSKQSPGWTKLMYLWRTAVVSTTQTLTATCWTTSVKVSSCWLGSRTLQPQDTSAPRHFGITKLVPKFKPNHRWSCVSSELSWVEVSRLFLDHGTRVELSRTTFLVSKCLETGAEVSQSGLWPKFLVAEVSGNHWLDAAYNVIMRRSMHLIAVKTTKNLQNFARLLQLLQMFELPWL